jgi:predicted Zn-dependent protease
MRSDPTLAAARERLIRLHLAEGRVMDAARIHRFASPKKKNAPPSLEMKLLAIEIQARLGNEPDLSIPSNATISLRELQLKAVDALARGLRLRDGAQEASEILAQLESQVDSASKDIFVKAQVELLLEGDDSVAEAIAVARRANAELPGRRLVLLSLGQALLRSGKDMDLDEAENVLLPLLDRAPNDLSLLTSLGDLAALRSDDATALLRFDEALARAPDHWPAVSGRFALLMRTDRREEATAALQTYLDRDNPYDGQAALVLARALEGDPSAHDRRKTLARRATRFGAGADALELLTSLDPEAAADFEVRAPSPTPEAQPGEAS